MKRWNTLAFWSPCTNLSEREKKESKQKVHDNGFCVCVRVHNENRIQMHIQLKVATNRNDDFIEWCELKKSRRIKDVVVFHMREHNAINSLERRI